MQAITTTERPGAPAAPRDDRAEAHVSPRGAVLSQHVTSEGLVTYTRGQDGRVQVWVDRTPQRRAVRG